MDLLKLPSFCNGKTTPNNLCITYILCNLSFGVVEHSIVASPSFVNDVSFSIIREKEEVGRSKNFHDEDEFFPVLPQ